MTFELWKLLAITGCLVASTYGLHVATEMLKSGNQMHAHLAIPCMIVGTAASFEAIRTFIVYGAKVFE